MEGAVVGMLPPTFRKDYRPLDVDEDLAKQPALHTRPRWSRLRKNVAAFVVFSAFGAASLMAEMELLPRWASFDRQCSPATRKVSTTNYRSDDRFYSEDMKAPPPPTFRGAHRVLCAYGEPDERKFQYCLPITSQADPTLCAGADRMDLLARQSPSTLCRASVLHLLLSDVYEEMEAAGVSPSVNLTSTDASISSIWYNGNVSRGGDLDTALRQKGYHLFEGVGGWRVCVAPTHPLAAHLYDPDREISASGNAVLHVDLVVNSTVAVENSMTFVELAKATEGHCSPRMVDIHEVEYDGSNGFYAMLQTTKALPAPVFKGDHKVLCSDKDRKKRSYRYCLPISGRKAASFCAGADRSDLLAHPPHSDLCYASVLHMLLADVYDELKATGSDPLVTFGTLLGAIRNESIIPFTEDADIAYTGSIKNNGALNDALWNKGYHLFQLGIWRVCVAPTHPLASILYDPDGPLAQDCEVPYVDLYGMVKHSFIGYWRMEKAKGLLGLLPIERVDPFSQVAINGQPYNTVHDAHYLLEGEYGEDYMKPKPRWPIPEDGRRMTEIARTREERGS
jgi:hypothetical protein